MNGPGVKPARPRRPTRAELEKELTELRRIVRAVAEDLFAQPQVMAERLAEDDKRFGGPCYPARAGWLGGTVESTAARLFRAVGAEDRAAAVDERRREEHEIAMGRAPRRTA